MYSELREYLKRPALYERTNEKFWTDPHISAQMLEAHLDPNTDAASRKPEFMDRSANWILTLPLPYDARLLDIGCGPGLYTKRFAERGLCVTGMDFSERSIAYTKEHDPKSEYLLRDYLTLDIENTFDIVTLIYCDYGALTPEERHELLRRVYRALKSGGLFLFDVFTPTQYAGRGESAIWYACENGGFWSGSPHICADAEYLYGETACAAYAHRYVVIEEAGVRCYNLWDTCFTRQSVLDEVSPVGFVEEGFYGDAAGIAYSEDSKTMCVILRK